MALAPRAAWVATLGPDCVGLIAGHLTRRFDCEGELEWIDTSANHRRMGIAIALFAILADWFVEHHARRICANLAEDNLAARAFYARHRAEVLRPHWVVWPDIRSVLARPKPQI